MMRSSLGAFAGWGALGGIGGGIISWGKRILQAKPMAIYAQRLASAQPGGEQTGPAKLTIISGRRFVVVVLKKKSCVFSCKQTGWVSGQGGLGYRLQPTPQPRCHPLAYS